MEVLNLNKQLWDECVKFHGHECPGLAIGFKVCEAAIEKMGIDFSTDEQIVCVSENDICAIDAIQYILSCTVGKGNLLFHETGKIAYSFYNRINNTSIRIYLKPFKGEMSKEERKKYLLNSSINELFEFSKPNFKLPERAVIFNTIICEKCKEGVSENKIRIQDGKMVCLDCFNEYSRRI